MDFYNVYLRSYLGPESGVLPLGNMQNIENEHAAAAALAKHDVKNNREPRTREQLETKLSTMGVGKAGG